MSGSPGRPIGAYSRPLGVTVLAVLTAISAVLTAVGGIVALLALRSDLDPIRSVAFLGVVVAFVAFVVATGYGFVEIRPWGWPLGIAFFGMDLAWSLLQGNLVGSLIVDVVALAYLLRPSVRKAFVGWATVVPEPVRPRWHEE